MAMFDPKLSPGQVRSTSGVSTPKVDLFSGLVAGLAALSGAAKAPAEDKSSALLIAAESQAADNESELLLGLNEADSAAAKFPKLFEDGVVSEEDAKVLSEAGYKASRIQSIVDPTRRKLELNRQRKEFLKGMSGNMDPAVVQKVMGLFDMKTAEAVVEQHYGEDVYKSVRMKYQNPTPIHFAAEMARKRAQDKIADEGLAFTQASRAGDYTAANMRSLYSGIANSSATTAFLQIQQGWDKNGAVTTDQRAQYNTALSGIKSQLLANLQSDIAAAQDRGEVITSAARKESEDAINEIMAPFYKIEEKIGTDPMLQSRMKGLFETLGLMPDLITGKDFGKIMELAAQSDRTPAVLANLLVNTKGKERVELLKQLHVQQADEGNIVELASHMVRSMKNLMDMDTSRLPDPADKRLAQYLSTVWMSGKTNDPIPPKVIQGGLDALKGATDAVSRFKYLNQNPAFTENILGSTSVNEFRDQIRNDINLIQDELAGEELVWDQGTNRFIASARSATQTWGGVGAVVSVAMGSGIPGNSLTGYQTNGLNEALKYLRSPNAKAVLGDDLYNELDAFAKGKPLVEGKVTISGNEAANWLEQDLSKKGEKDLTTMLDNAKRTRFGASPAQDKAKLRLVQQLETALTAELAGRVAPDKGRVNRNESFPEAGKWEHPTPAARDAGRKQFEMVVRLAATEHGVPEDLAVAVAEQESAWDPLARSGADAYGLMQVRGKTAGQYGYSVDDLKDPEKAAQAGNKHLAFLFEKVFPADKFSDPEDRTELVVASYNAGQGTVKKILDEHGGDWAKARKFLPPETKKYLKKVLAGMNE